MCKIRNKYLMMSGVIMLALFTASTGIAQVSPAAEDNMTDIVDDIKPYEGSTGPDSVFYGLRLTMENMGEIFTFDETEKVKKQIENAEMRIAEAKAELNKRNTEAMNKALEQYREKIKTADDGISGSDGENPELLDLQERIIKHQLILRNLSESQPGNVGLETALNNSKRLEEKFELRTGVKLERETGDDRLMVRVRGIEIEKKEIETEIEDNAAKVKVKVKFIAGGVDRNVIEKEIIEKLKLGKDDIGRIMKEVEVSKTPTSTPTSTGTPGATVTGTPRATGTPSSTPEMERPEDELRVRVESGSSVSEVEVEVRFTLNTVNRDEIINGIEQKLSAMKVDDLSKVQIEFDDRREDRRGRDGEAGDDRRGRDGEVGDDRGGRAGEVGDDRGGRAGEVGDDRGASSGSDSGSSGGGSGGGGGGGSSDD